MAENLIKASEECANFVKCSREEIQAQIDGDVIVMRGGPLKEYYRDAQRLNNFRVSQMAERAALGIKYYD